MIRFARRVILGIVGLVVVLLIAGGVAFYWMGLEGSSGLERWIGRQVQKLTSTYINPKMTFDDLDYTYPRTVVLQNFRLSADDPDHPGEQLDVILVKKLHIELAEIPKEGQPIRIEKLILDGLKLQIVSAESDPRLFIGLTNFIKQAPGEPAAGQQPSSTRAPGEPSPTAPPEEVKLSEVFQITLLELKDSAVIYDHRGGDTPPMKLDGINSRMDVVKDEAGRYKLAMTLDRKPVIDMEAEGLFDLDNVILEITNLTLSAELAREHDSYLPPDLQQLLKDHDITGQLSLKGQGTIPLSEADKSNISSNFQIANAHFVAGEYRGQADRITGDLTVKDQLLSLTGLNAATLGGQVSGELKLGLADNGVLDARLHANNIRLEQTLRAVEGGKGEPKYRGLLTASTNFNAPADHLDTQASGSGVLSLREGEIDNLPIISQIGKALAAAFKVVVGGDEVSDQVDMVWSYQGNKVHFSKIDMRTPTYAVRGDGDYYFEDRLDLYLNGGPLEKVQTLLGEVGRVLGKVTDQIIRYHVTGPIGDPVVTPEPLGIGG